MENIITPDFFNKVHKKEFVPNHKLHIDETEKIHNLIICECGCTDFKVFVTTIIDDCRLYCSKCGKQAI